MKYAFVNGVILDGTQDMEPQSGKIILVDDEKIAAIVDAGADISGYEKIDLGGSTLCPVLSICISIFPRAESQRRKNPTRRSLSGS